MWQTECCGLACGALGFCADCQVVGVGQLVELPCFPFLLVRVVADEPFSIPSSASIVIVIWVVDGCVWLWDCRLLLYVLNVSCCCVFRRDRKGGRVVLVRCVLPIGGGRVAVACALVAADLAACCGPCGCLCGRWVVHHWRPTCVGLVFPVGPAVLVVALFGCSAIASVVGYDNQERRFPVTAGRPDSLLQRAVVLSGWCCACVACC